jgi:hypothetical protein
MTSTYERALTSRGAVVVAASTFLPAGRAIRTEPLDVLLLHLGGFPEGDGRWIVHEAAFWDPRLLMCAVSLSRIDVHLRGDLMEHDVLVLTSFPELKDADNVVDCLASLVRCRASESLDHVMRALSFSSSGDWQPELA